MNLIIKNWDCPSPKDANYPVNPPQHRYHPLSLFLFLFPLTHHRELCQCNHWEVLHPQLKTKTKKKKFFSKKIRDQKRITIIDIVQQMTEQPYITPPNIGHDPIVLLVLQHLCQFPFKSGPTFFTKTNSFEQN